MSFAFWCSRCKISHAGECPPAQPMCVTCPAGLCPGHEMITAGPHDHKAEGWWASQDGKSWSKTGYDYAHRYPFFQFWNKGRLESDGISSGWGTQPWPPPIPSMRAVSHGSCVHDVWFVKGSGAPIDLTTNIVCAGCGYMRKAGLATVMMLQADNRLLHPVEEIR